MLQGTASVLDHEVEVSPLDRAVMDCIDRLEAIGDPDSQRSADRLRLQLAWQRRP